MKKIALILFGAIFFASDSVILNVLYRLTMNLHPYFLRQNLFYYLICLSAFLFGLLASVYLENLSDKNKSQMSTGNFSKATVFINIAQTADSQFFFKNTDYEQLKSLNGIELISPRVLYSSKTKVAYKGDTLFAKIIGESSSYFQIEELSILKGRPIKEKDVFMQNKICYIGYDISKQFNCDTGDYFLIDDLPFKVCGVFQSKESPLWDNMRNNSIFIPYTSLQEIFMLDNRIDQITIVLNDNNSTTITEIEECLHTLGYTSSEYTIYNLSGAYNKIVSISRSLLYIKWILCGFITIIAGLSLYLLFYRTNPWIKTHKLAKIGNTLAGSILLGDLALIVFLLTRQSVWFKVFKYISTDKILAEQEIIFPFLIQIILAGLLPVVINLTQVSRFNK